MACGEPFRICFPLGLIIGISGVMLWPLTFSGLHKFYPGVMHGRMMIEGFMAAFVFGFLGTAGPRLTDTAPFSRWELGGTLLLLMACMGLHIGHQTLLGDACFLTLLLGFVFTLGRRFWSKRADRPPPGFVLVGPAFLCAIVGTAGLIAAGLGLASAPVARLSQTLLYEMWLLLLILGVGSFLIPRILQVPPSAAECNAMPGWGAQALGAGATGVALLALAGFEAFYPGAVRAIAVGRFVVVAGFFFSQIGLHRGQAARVTIPKSLNVAILFLLAGLLFPAFWPEQRMAALHLLFIGGFGLMTLTVATRVVLGHSGFDFLFTSRLPFLAATGLFFAAAALLRAGADFFAPLRSDTLSIAAMVWMAGAALWGWKVLPKVRLADPE